MGTAAARGSALWSPTPAPLGTRSTCSARPTAPGVLTPCLSAEILGQPPVLDPQQKSQERNLGRSQERNQERSQERERNRERSLERERSQEKERSQERNQERERNQTRVRFTLLSQCELGIDRKNIPNW